MVGLPAILTDGLPFTVIGAVGSDKQPVAVSLNLKVTVPCATAVTTPASVTVAIEGLLLVHVPPVVGDNVLVAPIQMAVGPVIDTDGPVVTVTVEEASDEQPVAVLVNVKVAVPIAIPVTKPVLVIVATAGSLLTQVPPVVGDRFVVEPTHIEAGPFNTVNGLGLTVMAPEGADTQPASEVKVNVTTPAETPVTTPPSVMVAIPGALLAHVPPEEGVNVVVPPIQMPVGPVMVTVGGGMTATLMIGSEGHPADDVNINIAVPCVKPVTRPALVTEATAGLKLTHVPPLDGNTFTVPPIHIGSGLTIETEGFADTVPDKAADTHPVLVCVNVNVTEPADIPVIKPALVIVATAELLLAHVPPAVGVTVVVKPSQIVDGPVNATAGGEFTVTGAVLSETQPEASVK
jgi:hypothetical protein